MPAKNQISSLVSEPRKEPTETNLNNTETTPVQQHWALENIVTLIIGIVAVAIISSLVTWLFIAKWNVNAPTNQPPIPIVQPTIISTPTPIPTTDETEAWETYTDSVENFSFKYPQTWIISKTVPAEYSIQNGKMFQRNCYLFLQNENIKSSLIAMEVGNSEDFCWSAGKFEPYKNRTTTLIDQTKEIEVSKWLRINPAQSSKTFPWEGEIFQQITTQGAVIALVYKEGEDPSAERVYDRILSTFKSSKIPEITWVDAMVMIRKCEVKGVGQTHALDVTLTLKNGTSVRTKEPAIDDVFSIVDEVKTKCGDISIKTE